MQNFQRGRIYQSLSAGQGRRDLSCSQQQQSMRNACFRQLQQYCTQKAENKGGKVELPPRVENALSEMPTMRSSPAAGVTSARTPGWAVEDWQLKHPSRRKHSWFHGSPVIPGWHQNVKPATKGHTAHTTSLAATWLASSFLSFPWHENTTEEEGP